MMFTIALSRDNSVTHEQTSIWKDFKPWHHCEFLIPRNHLWIHYLPSVILNQKLFLVNATYLWLRIQYFPHCLTQWTYIHSFSQQRAPQRSVSVLFPSKLFFSKTHWILVQCNQWVFFDIFCAILCYLVECFFG